jgi:hypothetical protein
MSAPVPRTGDEPYLYLAGYLAGRPEHRRLAACRDAVRRGDLPYLAHYSDQACNFALDRLGGAVEQVARVRHAALEVGDELVYRLKDFDQRLAAAQSGALIRTVYETAAGALYCFAVVPGEYVVAYQPDPAGATAADRAVSALVTALREDLGRGDQHPGGWQAGGWQAGGWQSGGATPAASTDLAVHASGGAIGAVPAACRRALSVADLHYVAWIRDREPRYAADVLDAPALARFFPRMDITPAVRREFYGRLGRVLGRVSPELTALVEPVAGEPLRRVVLDVEEGAAFWHRLAPGEFLLGVTLDQRRVSTAADRMVELTNSVQK